MRALVLDAGAFVAAERGDRRMLARLGAAHRHGIDLRASAVVVGQVWRDGRRQATLSRLLRSVDVRGVRREDGHAAGELLARSNSSDVIDAACVLLATDGDAIVTSDPSDLRRLIEAADLKIAIIAC